MDRYAVDMRGGSNWPRRAADDITSKACSASGCLRSSNAVDFELGRLLSASDNRQHSFQIIRQLSHSFQSVNFGLCEHPVLCPLFYVLEPLLKTRPYFNMTAESRYDEKAYDARMKELCDLVHCACPRRAAQSTCLPASAVVPHRVWGRRNINMIMIA